MQMTITLWIPFKRRANQPFFILNCYFSVLMSLWKYLKQGSSGMWHHLVQYRGTVVSDVPAACMFTTYSENWNSRLVRNFGSSNSSGDLKVPSQQVILFPMAWFISRSTALFLLQILCSFGWKWDDRDEWWMGKIWKEDWSISQPNEIRNFVLKNTSPVRPDRFVSQKIECRNLFIAFTARQRINLNWIVFSILIVQYETHQ
jgi:hypothetical protein